MEAFGPRYLTDRLASLTQEHGASPERYVVALSGGVDSVALLHALVSGDVATPVLAIHVDHGLHADSAAWATEARSFAERCDVDCRVERAQVRNLRKGLEAAARTARYAVFERLLEPGDWLLSAHHRDDQAETILLNLLRGSGLLGLAGMPALRPLGKGLVARPLLDVARSDLAAYVTACGIAWNEDPSNSDLRFDRNFLRHEILPRIESRWSAARGSLARSATLIGQAQTLLDDLAAEDLNLAMTAAADRLSVAVLRNLATERQRNVLRYAIRMLGLPSPPATRLEQILTELLPARADAEPMVAWENVSVRRYREELFILDQPQTPVAVADELYPDVPLDLGPELGVLELEHVSGRGIRPEIAERGLAVRFREGGERLRPRAGGKTQRLKTLLQSEGVLPWMRASLPLLYHHEELVAVADLWIDAAYQAEPGYRVVWRDGPLLY